ncbi:MAG: GNAT family N-acetyltransferase [Pseudomonadota bacterium]
MKLITLDSQTLNNLITIENDESDDIWQAEKFSGSFVKPYLGWLAINSVSDSTTKNKNGIGYLLVQDCIDFIDIIRIKTHFTYRRQGVAQFLMQQLIMHANKTHQRIMLEVRESNIPAIQLYFSFGFKQIDIRRHYYLKNDGREDALILQYSAHSN